MSDTGLPGVADAGEAAGVQDSIVEPPTLNDTGLPGVADAGDPSPDVTVMSPTPEELSLPPSNSETSNDETRSSKKLVFGIFFLALVVIGGLGALGFVLIDGSNGDDTTTTSVASAKQTTDTVADDFDRPDNAETLGRAATGQQWETPSGTWGIADQQARVVTPNPNELGRSWAVTELGSGDGSVSATASRMTNGWGLLFRYRGPFNYWMLFGSTEYGTYNLVKVVDGKSESVTSGGIGLAPVKNGTRVGVQFRGPTISILLNDQIVGVYRDPALQNATKVGMVVSSGGASAARWDDFTAQAAPRPAGVGANSDGG
jgi:hypothetical protein